MFKLGYYLFTDQSLLFTELVHINKFSTPILITNKKVLLLLVGYEPAITSIGFILIVIIGLNHE